MGTILIAILILVLVGALPTWPHSKKWGYYPSGGIGLVLLIVLILLLMGHLKGKKEGVTCEKNNMDDRIAGVFVSCSGGDGSAILGRGHTSHGGRPHISYRRGSAPLCS